MARTLVSLIRNLQRRNARRRQPLAVLEGVRVCENAVAANVSFEGAVMSSDIGRSDRGTALLNTLRNRGVSVEEVPDVMLRDLADTESPQGIVAVVHPPVWSLEQIDVAASRPVLVLDALQDPGNVGTIIRTAFALGASGLIALPGTVQLTHPKLLRSSLGASFRYPVVKASADRVIEWSLEHDVALWVAAADGRDVREQPTGERVAIVIGNEGAGVGKKMGAAAMDRVAVRIRPEAESLNAAAAAAILLHEATR